MIAAEGIARDITEQVQAEAEIVERELLSRSVLESIQGPATVVDAEGTDPRGERRLDHGHVAPSRRSDRGQRWARTISSCATRKPPAASPGPRRRRPGCAPVLSGAEESFSFDYPVYGTDEEHWFVMQVSPLRTETGGAVVHHVDITDRKLYEQQLARHALRDSAHRARQPGAPLRPPRRRAGPFGCADPERRAAAARPRPVQHRQRRARPRGGRRPARGRLRPDPQARPSGRHRRAARRRRVRRALRRAHQRPECRRARGPHRQRIQCTAPRRRGRTVDRHHEHRGGAR